MPGLGRYHIEANARQGYDTYDVHNNYLLLLALVAGPPVPASSLFHWLSLVGVQPLRSARARDRPRTR